MGMKLDSARQVNILLHWAGVLYLKVMGWTVEGGFPEVQRSIVVVAHHTSSWDFPFCIAYSFAARVKIHWMGKSALFAPPFMGWLYRKLGGISIERNKAQGVVGEAVRAIESREFVALAITPEGTRKHTNHWKSGFYRIAREAKIPLLLGYIDFKRKAVGIHPDPIHLTGDVEADLDKIRRVYDAVTARYPDKASEIRFLRPPE
jgi:1-acyl-sn-glycerol-3-phosphate acyltransferase